MMQNPVIPGFFPDPSVCAASDYFYLAASSFAFYPGIPLFRSKSLVDWEHIGHALTQDHIDFTTLEISDGVWAPTLRYHEGLFYLVFSVSHGPQGMKTYLMTTNDPAGLWSAPKQLHIEGFDPSLFFDDGRVWLTICRDAKPSNPQSPGALWLAELDLESQEVVGPEILIWGGALKGAWVEAPRIYKKDNTYWLIAAEGGTERKHAVTAAYSESITGPYRGDDRNPLLTHRHLGESSEIANVGHADLVEDNDGNWWAVALGVRPIDGHHVLGREVFLLPVEWDSQGLVFAPGDGRVLTDIRRYSALETSKSGAQSRMRILQQSESIGTHGAEPLGSESHGIESSGAKTRGAETLSAGSLAWVSARTPKDVHADGESLSFELNFKNSEWLANALMTRQRTHTFEFKASIEPEDGAATHFVFAFQNRNRYLLLSLSTNSDAVTISCERNLDGEITYAQFPDELARSLGSPAVTFGVSSDSTTYEFTAEANGIKSVLWSEPHEFFSTESAGGFVGTMLGVAATHSSTSTQSSGNSESARTATFRGVTMTSTL